MEAALEDGKLDLNDVTVLSLEQQQAVREAAAEAGGKLKQGLSRAASSGKQAVEAALEDGKLDLDDVTVLSPKQREAVREAAAEAGGKLKQGLSRAASSGKQAVETALEDGKLDLDDVTVLSPEQREGVRRFGKFAGGAIKKGVESIADKGRTMMEKALDDK